MKKLVVFAFLSLLFIPVLATADTVAVSHAGLAYTCGAGSSCTAGTTVAITPHPAWAGPFAGSEWISYDQTGAGGIVPVNGTTMLVLDTFTATYGAIDLSVLADDTTGVTIFTLPAHSDIFDFAAALDPSNTYATCSDVTIGCLNSTAGHFLVPVTAGQEYGLLFNVYQQNGSAFGLDYSVNAVPEPGSMALLGSGLMLAAGAIRRRLSL